MFWKKHSVWIEIGFGEALDRLSILRIKSEKFDGAKKVIIDQERKKLEKSLQKCIGSFIEVLFGDLFITNQALWDIEDEIRQVCECDDCSDEALKNCSELARKVYKFNAMRSQIKRQIDDFLESSIMEIKDYRGKQND